MKKEGNHKRAQKSSAKRSKSERDKRGKEKRARKKKVSKIRVVVVVVVVVGAPKSLKNFQKKKNKNSLLGFSPLKIKARRPRRL